MGKCYLQFYDLTGLSSKDLDGCYKQGLAFEGSAECRGAFKERSGTGEPPKRSD